MQHSKDVSNIIRKAKDLSLSLKRPNVCLDTLFHSVLSANSSTVVHILSSLSIERGDMRILSDLFFLKKKASKNPSKHLSKDVGNIIKLAEEIAESQDSDYCATEHLLAAIFSYEKKTSVMKALDEDDETSQKIADQVVSFLNNTIPHGVFEFREDEDEEEDVEKTSLDMFEENKILKEFAVNLNLKASKGDFDNLINHDPDKLDEITVSLLRKRKANIVLVGNGGVGKTQWVNLLAKMIVDGEAPELLLDKVIYSVDLSRMVAGTEFRGMFEKRLTEFVEEAKKYDNLILFFDEIHALVGAGGSGRKNDLEASNILKPALADGDLSVIGATTNEEYELKIKGDSALDRRFNKVIIPEPSKFKMKEILPKLAEYYEDAHDVVFSDAFLEDLIENCEKYMPNKRYPDKAIDILDTIGAKAKMKFQGTPDYIKKAQKELMDISTSLFKRGIEDNEDEIQKKIDEIKKSCAKWEKDYAGEKRIVESSYLDSFFERKKRMMLRQKVETLSEFVNEDLFKKISESDRKQNSILIYGDKQSGKTTFCRAISDFAKKNEIDVIHFSGLDFSINELIKRVSNTDSAVIVIDDISNLDPQNIRFLVKTLKDKRIERTSGEIIDFSNCDFFLTCDTKKAGTVGFDKNIIDSEPNLDKDLCKVICNKFLINVECP